MTGLCDFPLSKPSTIFIGHAAIRALHTELLLYPKPGLVSAVDNGAHDDMDAGTFLRSIFALRHYFKAIASAGAAGSPFSILQHLGIEAEQRMLRATGGVNTHRGGIFCMGLLAAAAGWRHHRGLDCNAEALADTVVTVWGDGISNAGRAAANSHGDRAVRLYGARGARAEALAGFPTLLRVALPTLRSTFKRLECWERACIQTLFATMADLQDTNLLHRGGTEGLRFVQMAARDFLDKGGVYSPAWRSRALALHGDCVALNLSPGGAADVLAAACFLYELQA
jgi:triphosphoribosyl-dephospho-CoA synthase